MAMSYREREAQKKLAVNGTDAEVRRRCNDLAERLSVCWLNWLPVEAAREALVGLALWERHREHGGTDQSMPFLRRWAHVIEPTGRLPSPDRRNALAAFMPPPAKAGSALSY